MHICVFISFHSLVTTVLSFVVYSIATKILKQECFGTSIERFQYYFSSITLDCIPSNINKITCSFSLPCLYVCHQCTFKISAFVDQITFSLWIWIIKFTYKILLLGYIYIYIHTITVFLIIWQVLQGLM